MPDFIFKMDELKQRSDNGSLHWREQVPSRGIVHGGEESEQELLRRLRTFQGSEQAAEQVAGPRPEFFRAGDDSRGDRCISFQPKLEELASHYICCRQNLRIPWLPEVISISFVHWQTDAAAHEGRVI